VGSAVLGWRHVLLDGAQVLPVLLLALVIELRILGTPRRHFLPDLGHLPNVLEVLGRTVAALMTVALLWGELQSARALLDSSDSASTWPVALGSAWGFVTVAVVASFGARPRVIATLKARPREGRKDQFILEAGGSNELGDKDVSPVMNFLVPDGVGLFSCDQFGNLKNVELDLLETDEQIPPNGPEKWHYVHDRVLLTAGDSVVKYYIVSAARARVVLRFDHRDIPRGRAQTDLTLTYEPREAAN
jgi:hypothetical protein